MRNNLSRTLVSPPTLIFLSLLAVGCMETRAIQVSEINPNSDQRMTVFTKDGRAIQFEHQQYRVETNGAESFLRGDGIVKLIPGQDGKTPFSGSIRFSQIDSIYVHEFGTVTNTIGLGIVIAGSAVVLAFIIAWIHGPISIG